MEYLLLLIMLVAIIIFAFKKHRKYRLKTVHLKKDKKRG